MFPSRWFTRSKCFFVRGNLCTAQRVRLLHPNRKMITVEEEEEEKKRTQGAILYGLMSRF